MNKENKNKDQQRADFFLDITPETCPMTFVRTKLMIEKMASGEIIEVHLKGSEPLENVPRSVQDMGHSVLSLDPVDTDAGGDGVYRLLVLKT
ncbi:MAG TPA: sulfurtransferase TusA family protein [Rhodospirillales bacterium]|nr:sulfurtransferase TusA family protein [Rhodospirillales bacterium]|tara:strand:+ start:111 stop:386 length:276 start_codon:yes stop_codon:yes gene_type:complete